VRSYRHRLIERAMPDPKVQAEAAEPAPFEPAAARVGADDRNRIVDADPREAKLSALVGEFAKNLAALDRYERRALSRRKFAIREFDLARIEAERAPGTR
jgi:hypothetical protein